jgi:hypothetical protein
VDDQVGSSGLATSLSVIDDLVGREGSCLVRLVRQSFFTRLSL